MDLGREDNSSGQKLALAQ